MLMGFGQDHDSHTAQLGPVLTGAHVWPLSGLMQPGDLVMQSSHHSPPGSTALWNDSRPPARGKEKEQPSPTAQPQ